MYYIYHIPGIKIGCTSDLEKRMSDQGFTEWDILETHTDIYEVSDREIQLQKDYGLPVDTEPYYVTVEKRLLATEAGHTTEAKAKRSQSLLGNTNGAGLKGIPKSEEWKTKMDFGGNFNNKRVTCEYCDHPPMNVGNYTRWHGDNCKHKKRASFR